MLKIMSLLGIAQQKNKLLQTNISLYQWCHKQSLQVAEVLNTSQANFFCIYLR